jgi:hypothetical protein
MTGGMTSLLPVQGRGRIYGLFDLVTWKMSKQEGVSNPAGYPFFMCHDPQDRVGEFLWEGYQVLRESSHFGGPL